MFGKVMCLYLVVLLFVITVSLYAWLSRVNNKTSDIWSEMNLGSFCLVCLAVLFRICNYAHYFANTVRYQNTLYEYIYIYIYIYSAFYLYYLLECKSRSYEKIIPPGTKYECSIPADGHSPNTVRTVTKVSCVLGKLI